MKKTTLVDSYDLYRDIKIQILNIDEFKDWEDHTYTLIHVLPKEHYQNLHNSMVSLL